MQTYLEVWLLFFIVRLNGFDLNLVLFNKFYKSNKNCGHYLHIVIAMVLNMSLWLKVSFHTHSIARNRNTVLVSKVKIFEAEPFFFSLLFYV